mgnify:CR=1 FL=1|tara:strand:- start:8676 stop:8906 length:231 start_codon:yes stop_codon:yes gene_type:complete
MVDGWQTNDSAVIVGESVDDEDSLVICLVDETQSMMTAILDRSEIESLVEYMAEWVGFPLILNSTMMSDEYEWTDE